MKKMHLLLILAVSLFLSCKKEKEDDAFHISCKINGVEKTFSAAITAGSVVNGGVAGLVISGASSTSETGDGIAFVLTKSGNDAITAGTYADTGTDFQLLVTYYDGASEINNEAGTETYKEAVHEDKPIANHFSLVVSSIDDNTARGTFSGDSFPEGDLDGMKKSITEGSFYVNLVTN